MLSLLSAVAQNNNPKPLYTTQFIKDEISVRLNNMVDFEFDDYGRAWILLTNGLVLFDGNKYEFMYYSQLGIPDYSFKEIYKNSSGGLYLVGYRDYPAPKGLRVNLKVISFNPLVRTWQPLSKEIENVESDLVNFFTFDNKVALIKKNGFFYVNNNEKWEKKFSISNVQIKTIFPAERGNWHAFSKNTYFKLDKNGIITDSTILPEIEVKDFIQFTGQAEKCFLRLENDNVLLIDQEGNIQNKIFFNKKAISLDSVVNIYVDKNKRVWLKYLDNVTVYYDIKNNYQIFEEIKNPNIYTRGLFPIKQDNVGNIWIDLGSGFFYNQLINEGVTFFFKDKGISFRGLQQINDSIIYFNSYKGNGFLNINSGKSKYLSSVHNYLLGALYNKNKNEILLGTNNPNYEVLNLDNFQIKKVGDTKKNAFHFAFLEKGLNKVHFWLGDFGFQLFDVDKSELREFIPLPSNHSAISSFYDNKSFYLVGTDQGLLKYSIKKGDWSEIKYIPKVRITGIKCINNSYFISTAANGLFVLNEEFKPIKHIQKKLEAMNKFIFSMLLGSDQMLWLGTEKGLYRLNPLNGKYNGYTFSDGIHEEEFNWLSAINLKNGDILMGTIDGLVKFNPRKMDVVSSDFNKGHIYFSSIDINNNSNTRNRNGLAEYIRQDKITLNPNEYSLTLYPGFSNFYFGKLIFFYVKTPYLDDWQLVKNFNSITLSPTAGESNIQIRISTDSPENFIKEINIPMVKRQHILENKIFLWFASILFLFLIAIIFFLRYRLVSGKNVELEKDLAVRVKDLELNEQTLIDKNNKLAILNEERRRFFDILGHEVNTPLAGMKQLSHTFNYLLKRGEYEKALKIAQSLEHSGTEISHLVDNLLTWSNLEKNTQLSRNLSFSITDKLNSTIDLFIFQIHRKNIKFNLSLPEEFDGEIDSDPNIISFVLRNILSNAIKYCPDGGDITCTLHRENDCISLTVYNSSEVLSADNFSTLIALSPVSSLPGTLQEKGLGIGLFMVCQLILIIKGTIAFDIHPEGGVTALIKIKS